MTATLLERLLRPPRSTSQPQPPHHLAPACTPHHRRRLLHPHSHLHTSRRRRFSSSSSSPLSPASASASASAAPPPPPAGSSPPPSLHVDTLLVHGSVGAMLDVGAPYSPASMPIYQTATFSSPSSLSSPRFDYTRSGNPTRYALQQQLASIEGAAHAFAFSTGMAALSVVTRLLSHGQGVLGSDDSYGGTVRLLARVLDHTSHPTTFCDHSDLTCVEDALTRHPHIRLIMARTQRSTAEHSTAQYREHHSPAAADGLTRPTPSAPARRLLRCCVRCCDDGRLRAQPTL